MKKLAILLFIAAGMAACKGKKNVVEVPVVTEEITENALVIDETDESEPVQVIYYERTVCFGTCPSFIFTIDSDGSASYEGRNFVDLIGKHSGESSPMDIASVMKIAKEVGYDTLQTAYDNPLVMDLPSTITIIGEKKVLNRYQGPALEGLYNHLDKLIAEIQWTKIKE
ncbi:MAG: hypothetical protein GC193_13380 [Cryomorphaceae bacterium]|nr:hypothetical protein [Cryomorphaceae bacterium]